MQFFSIVNLINICFIISVLSCQGYKNFNLYFLLIHLSPQSDYYIFLLPSIKIQHMAPTFLCFLLGDCYIEAHKLRSAVFSGFFPLEGPGWDALLPLALPVWVWDESLEMRQCLLEWLSQPRKTVHGRPLLLPLELKIKSPLSTSNAGLMVRTTSEGA